jgi:hypothetical protein
VPSKLQPGAHADVEHHRVDAAERVGGFVDEPRALLAIGDVGDHARRPPARILDQANGLRRCVGRDVDDCDRGALPSGEHRDRLSIAGRRAGITRALTAAADDHHAPPCEPRRWRSGAGGRRRKGLLLLLLAHLPLLVREPRTVWSGAWP